MKLAFKVGAFDRDTRVVPKIAVEFVMINRTASYLPDVIWAEATICGKNWVGRVIRSIVGVVSVMLTHPAPNPNPYVWNCKLLNFT